jgi:hypothetical protein
MIAAISWSPDNVAMTLRRDPLPHHLLMGRALDLARQARAHGNHPFGALLADADGKVRLEAENTVVTEGDWYRPRGNELDAARLPQPRPRRADRGDALHQH